MTKFLKSVYSRRIASSRDNNAISVHFLRLLTKCRIFSPKIGHKIEKRGTRIYAKFSFSTIQLDFSCHGAHESTQNVKTNAIIRFKTANID